MCAVKGAHKVRLPVNVSVDGLADAPSESVTSTIERWLGQSGPQSSPLSWRRTFMKTEAYIRNLMNDISRHCVTSSHARTRHALALALIVAIVSCRADGVLGLDSQSQSRSARVGQEVEVTLGNVGPAIYESPPGISSSALMFLSVDVVPPYNPGGPTQRFRFKAVNAGIAIVAFRRTLSGTLVSIVEDTIQVR